MIIGVEGVSCTGKTTLAAALAAALGDPLVIGCYYHCAPGPSWLPPPDVTTAAAQLDSIRMLLRVEDLRLVQVQRAVVDGREVILDRTVDTVLAHTRALGRLHGFDVVEQARALVIGHSVAVPDLTLLLQAGPDTLAARAMHRKDMPAILYDPQFTEHFHGHFDLPVARRVVIVSTEATLHDTLRAALTAVALHRDTLATHPIGSVA